MKHPLLNENSIHYDTNDKPTIYEIEKELTIEEMIGACKFNIMKYRMRDKGQDVEDNEKITDYIAYRVFLELLIEEYKDTLDDIRGYRVRTIIDTCMPDLEYKS